MGSEAARIFVEALTRKGAILSADNEADLLDGHADISRGADKIMAVVKRATAPPPVISEPDEPDIEIQRAAARAAVAVAIAIPKAA
jgi:hypothetical protein